MPCQAEGVVMSESRVGFYTVDGREYEVVSVDGVIFGRTHKGGCLWQNEIRNEPWKRWPHEGCEGVTPEGHRGVVVHMEEGECALRTADDTLLDVDPQALVPVRFA